MATIDRYKIVVDVEGQQAINTLKSSLVGLGATIASIGFGAFIGNTIRMADALSDLASSTGLAGGQVKAFAASLEVAGGQFADVDKVLVTFYNNLDQVANGATKAIDAFSELGIAQSDLTKLSETALLQKAIDELAQMDAGARRTALGVEIFGKAFKTVDPKILQEAFRTQDVTKFTQEIEKAAQITANVEKSYRNLQEAVLNVVNQLVGNTDNLVLSIEKAETVIKALVAGFAIIAGAQVIAAIQTLIGIFKALTTVIKGTVVAQTALVALAGPKGWAIIAGAVVATTGAILALNAALDNTSDKAKALDESRNAANNIMGAGGAAYDPSQIKEDPRVKAAKQASDAAKATTAELRLQNKAALEYEQAIFNSIGLSNELVAINRVKAQLDKDIAVNAANYEKLINAEKAKGKDANKTVMTELLIQKNLTEKNLKASAENAIATINREQSIKRTTIELQKQLGIIEQEKQLTIANLEAVTNARMIAGEISQQEANNINAINKIREDGLAKTRTLEKQLANETDNLRKQELQNQLDATKQATDFAISEKQREIAEKKKLEESSTAGVMQALQDIEKQITPFNMAQEQTNLLFQRMNQGITDFATNGKLKFKDFALSLIRDLILIEVRAQASKFLISLFRNMFGGGFGTGNAFGNLDLGMFLAEGGPAKAGKPYIVGERGPELFVPKSAGTVIPNNQMGSRGVSAGAVSAPITNNYVTNNVNAIDSQSVAQFFANNRKLMLGSVEMARKEMPYGMSR